MSVSSLRAPRPGRGWADAPIMAALAAGCGVLRETELARERLDACCRTAGVA